MSPRSLAAGCRASLVVALITLVGVVAGCGEPRISLESWEQIWDRTVERVAAAEGGVSEEECSELLAYLREQRPRLNPLPAEGLETPVDSWFEVAEAAFFGCPPESESVSGWADAFEQLTLLEAEVRTVLARQP